MNIRKSINGNLGKCGEFSNRMIYNMLFNRAFEAPIVSENSKQSIKVCQKTYIKIVRVIFNLLEKCEKGKTKELLQCTDSDNTITLTLNLIGMEYKVIVPLQTYMLLSSSFDDGELELVGKIKGGEFSHAEYSEQMV